MQLSLELHIRVMHRCGTGDITAITACLSQVLGWIAAGVPQGFMYECYSILGDGNSFAGIIMGAFSVES